MSTKTDLGAAIVRSNNGRKHPDGKGYAPNNGFIEMEVNTPVLNKTLVVFDTATFHIVSKVKLMASGKKIVDVLDTDQLEEMGIDKIHLDFPNLVKEGIFKNPVFVGDELGNRNDCPKETNSSGQTPLEAIQAVFQILNPYENLKPEMTKPFHRQTLFSHKKDYVYQWSPKNEYDSLAKEATYVIN